MGRPRTNLEPHEASQIVMEHVALLDSEMVTLPDASGRILSTALPARLAQPRFRKATMDGYAVCDPDMHGQYREVGTIAAGDERDPLSTANLENGEAIRIMTGAVVPPDIARIIRFEYTESDDNGVIREVQEDRGANIAEHGENIAEGAPLLSPRRLSAADIGILASQGYWEVPVIRQPRVAILATGSELRSPRESTLPPWAIYDSNSVQLAALVENSLAKMTNYGIISDNQAEIAQTLYEAAQSHDMVICSGGVSMGDLDFVPSALETLGATIHFHGLAVKPGRPTLFGSLGGALVFGLPGNPVSTFAQCELYITPALYAMQGLEYRPREVRLPLFQPFSRQTADRHEFVPGYIRNGHIHQITYKGSGHLSALSAAELVFRVDRGVHVVHAGETVYARLIRTDDRLSENLRHRQM